MKNSLNNILSLFKEFLNLNENITEKRFEIMKTTLNNMTLLFKTISDKKENITEIRFDILKNSLYNITSFVKEMSNKRENITEMRFDILKNTLNNMTSFFKEMANQNENLSKHLSKFINNTDSEKNVIGENLIDIKKEFYDFFQEFKNLNIDRKEDRFQNTPEFQKLISSKSDSIEEAQNDKILVMLVVLCVLIAIIFSCLFVIVYKFISINKLDSRHEQVELLPK